MTASKQAKQAGFISLAEVARLLDVHVNTLKYRHANNLAAFKADLKRAEKLRDSDV